MKEGVENKMPTDRLNANEYADRGAELKKQGAEFDFTEFDVVTEGKKGPFFGKAKALKDKFGNSDIFILSARPQEAAPAMQAFLKGIGLFLLALSQSLPAHSRIRFASFEKSLSDISFNIVLSKKLSITLYI